MLETQAADTTTAPFDELAAPQPAAQAARALWRAVLVQYFKDVRDPRHDRGEALADFRGPRRILCRLADRAGYEPQALKGRALGDVQAAAGRRGR